MARCVLYAVVQIAENIYCAAKSTVSRLNATAEEKLAREKKMAAAIRTVLECIGEDPNREGLLRTPDRYAQAIMWMTRGYEERLAGTVHRLLLIPIPVTSEHAP